MPTQDIQTSFAGGEFAPEVQARVDIEKYKTGLATLRNMIVDPHGNAYNRPGTYFVGATKYFDRKSIIAPFKFSTTDTFVLEIGDFYIRFFKNGGQVGSNPNVSTIPYWNVGTTYRSGDLVLKLLLSGHTGLYQSLKYSNVSQDPVTAVTYWSPITILLDTWSGATTYAANDYVAEIRSSDGTQRIFKSLLGSNLNNDPLAPTTWWSKTSPDAWDATHTYATGDLVSFTDFLGNVSVYYSIQNGNLNHNIFTETLWWQFWNGAIYWDSGTTYAINVFVTILDGGGIYRCYKSLANSNTNHNPLTASTTYWTEITQSIPYEVVSPYSQTELAQLKYTQSADTIFFAHPSHPPQQLKRISDNNWSLTAFPFINGPVQFPNSNTDHFMSVTLSGGQYVLYSGKSSDGSAINYFDPGMIGGLFRLSYDVQGNKETYTGRTSSFTGSSLPCGTIWRFSTSGTWAGTISVQQSVDNGANWTQIQSFQSVTGAEQNFNTFGSVDRIDGTLPILVRANFGFSSGALNSFFSVDAFTQVNVYPVISFTSASSVVVTIPKDAPLVSGTLALSGTRSTEWAEGSWSNFRGWPATVAFFQDRLFFASTATEPQTDWGSQTSDYVNFGVSIPLVDSDAIAINLTSRVVNNILAVVPFLNSLMNFTNEQEWNVLATSGAAITPTTVFAKLQSTRGTGSVDPIMIGNRIMFLESRGSALREMVYQYFTDTFDSQNVSFLSSHLFQGHQIVSMAYQQEPSSLLWLVRDDGILICLTYIVEQNFIAWSRHDTSGNFESVCSIPGTSGDELWMVVKRGNNRFIERMTIRTLSTDPADQYFVDCGISYSGAPASSLSGYTHLAGLTVAVNAEGFVLTQRTVSDAGVVTLDKARSKAQVGLPYISDLETLNPQIQVPEGEFQGRKYRIARAVIRFLNTVGGYVGPDLNNLDPIMQAGRPSMRDPSLTATTPTPLFTGFVAFPMPRSAPEQGHIAFRQVDPMPVTILSIMPILEPGMEP